MPTFDPAGTRYDDGAEVLAADCTEDAGRARADAEASHSELTKLLTERRERATRERERVVAERDATAAAYDEALAHLADVESACRSALQGLHGGRAEVAG